MLWMTVYLWKSWDRSKSIEAEWCANALWWTLDNYVYYTLTSRNLRLTDNLSEAISPAYYFIQLTGTSNPEKKCIPENIGSWFFCKKIILWYSEEDIPTEINEYKNVTVSNTCRHGKPHLWFYRAWWTSGDIQYIRMNKWFTPKEANAERVFFLQQNWDTEDDKLLTWDIMVVLCSDDSCEWWKQIGKRQVDARSQTIAFKKCRYYEDNWNICKTREDCKVYSSSDPTACEEY